MSNNICKLHKNCQPHVQIHVQHCFNITSYLSKPPVHINVVYGLKESDILVNLFCTWNWPSLICKACQFITLRGNINFQFVPFSRYYFYKIVFEHIILCPSKRCLVHDANVHNYFSALNLTIIFIKPFACIVT